ncbi:hypothetical protein [Stenotrophomonas indicatrix]|nr:hypothetical protein [Stenotrophomonas indicatrix]
MRVGYFGYFVRDRETDERYLIDLRKFFREFAASTDVGFKSQFRYGGESLLLQLLDEDTNTYLFVQSRDLELVKRIQRKNLSADDISAIIGANNGIGFASYVVVGKHWVSFACRVLSPRHTAFSHFVNSLFQALTLEFDFVLRTFQSELGREVASQFDKVGRINIQVNTNSPLLQYVADFFTGGDAEELVDVQELHISIVPKRSRKADLSETLNEIIDRVPENGLESLTARARLEETDRMSDMYIYGAGAIRDFVFVDHESEVPAELSKAKRDNAKLKEKLEEFRADDEFQTDNTARSLGISWALAYGNRVDI